MTNHEDDRTQNTPQSVEEETGARGGDDTRDADALPGEPGSKKTALGDTDQHSKVPSQ